MARRARQKPPKLLLLPRKARRKELPRLPGKPVDADEEEARWRASRKALDNRQRAALTKLDRASASLPLPADHSFVEAYRDYEKAVRSAYRAGLRDHPRVAAWLAGQRSLRDYDKLRDLRSSEERGLRPSKEDRGRTAARARAVMSDTETYEREREEIARTLNVSAATLDAERARQRARPTRAPARERTPADLWLEIEAGPEIRAGTPATRVLRQLRRKVEDPKYKGPRDRSGRPILFAMQSVKERAEFAALMTQLRQRLSRSVRNFRKWLAEVGIAPPEDELTYDETDREDDADIR
jgi:hypothetical protein